MHGLVCGRAGRLLLDATALTAEEPPGCSGAPSRRVSRRPGLRRGSKGFLSGSGLVLVHDDQLFGVLGRWVSLLPEDRFTEVLPLLRRTFSTFGAPERRALGDRAAAGGGAAAAPDAASDDVLDLGRADLVVPTLRRLLGL